MTTFQVTAGNVVEKQISFAVGMPATKKAVLDRFLVFLQPVEIGIQVIFVEGIQTQHVAGGMAGGQPYGRQSRTLIDDPRQDLPQGAHGFLGIA
jgi:hypothetical protein